MQNSIKTFTKTVAASGTPESLQSNALRSTSIRVKALRTNTNPVYIGDSSSQDYPLVAGEELNLSELFDKVGGTSVLDMSKIFCKVTTNGEGVAVIYAVGK